MNLLLLEKLYWLEFASVFIKDFLFLVLLTKVVIISIFNDCVYLIDDEEKYLLQYYVLKGTDLTLL